MSKYTHEKLQQNIPNIYYKYIHFALFFFKKKKKEKKRERGHALGNQKDSFICLRELEKALCMSKADRR